MPNRITEIEARLAAIQNEIDGASGDALTALENEVSELTAERTKLLAEVETRQQLRSKVAAGIVTGKIIEPNTNEEERKMENKFTPASAEYRSAFLKSLRGEEMNEAEARAFTFLTTNTPAPIPTEMQNTIIDLIGEEHPIVADVYTLNSGAAISIPVAKSLAADAAKTEEGADHADLQVTIENIDLSGEDFTADVELSYKMAAMAIDAFESYLVSLIAERIGAKLAAGIVEKIKAGVNEANKIASGISYANVCAGFGALKRTGKPVVYGTRETVFNKLVGMVDSNKRPIFQQLGAVIKYEDAVGAGELLIGDPKKYLQNVVVPVMIEHDRVIKKSKLVYSGYTCQEGELTDDKAFAVVSEA